MALSLIMAYTCVIMLTEHLRLFFPLSCFLYELVGFLFLHGTRLMYIKNALELLSFQVLLGLGIWMGERGRPEEVWTAGRVRASLGGIPSLIPELKM